MAYIENVCRAHEEVSTSLNDIVAAIRAASRVAELGVDLETDLAAARAAELLREAEQLLTEVEARLDDIVEAEEAAVVGTSL